MLDLTGPDVAVLLIVNRTELDWFPSGNRRQFRLLGRAGSPLERLPGGLIGAIENSTGLRQGSAESRPRFCSRARKLLELILCVGGLSPHPRHGRVDVLPTFRREIRRRCMNFVCCFTPGAHLRGDLALEDSLLLADVPTEGLKVFLDFGLEALPLGFQPRLGGFPGGLALLGLLLDRALKLGALLA